MNDNNSFYVTAASIKISGGVTLTYVYSKYTILETSISLVGYDMAHKAKIEVYDCMLCGEKTEAFIASQLSFGAARKINTKPNFNLFDLHAGFALSYSFAEKGRAGRGFSYYVNSISNTLLLANTKDYMMKQFFSLLYVGISKQLHINAHFDFLISYRNYLGFLNMYKTDIIYANKALDGPN